MSERGMSNVREGHVEYQRGACGMSERGMRGAYGMSERGMWNVRGACGMSERGMRNVD